MTDDSIRQEPPGDLTEKETEMINKMADILFPNVKLYVESAMQRLDPISIELQDLKTNVATLSSLLHSKDAFTENEFRNCFAQMQKSFGETAELGEMSGRIEIIKYNF